VNFTNEITKKSFLFSTTTIMKKCYVLLCLFFSTFLIAQVGINTTTPNAQLDIQSSNQVTPANTDGLLIPKVDTFPATNPTTAQQGMLVYLTTTVGTNQPGFYYWNNPTTSWVPIKGTDTGTLDQAYDFGGAGNGRTITADAGAVLIDGTDGLLSTGTLNSGAIAPSGGGVKMFWNPRKAAFRAGSVSGTQWNDTNVGRTSVAIGINTTASGVNSVALGNGTTASGISSTALGNGSLATGNFSTALGAATSNGLYSTAMGINSISSGLYSTAIGNNSISNGNASTSIGESNTAISYGETAIGIGATTYTPSLNGDSQFRTANANDRLFVIGNAIDSNNNSFVDAAERSDAMVVLKNGLTRLPSTTNTMIDAADGKTVVTKEYLQSSTSGTLDQAYDFGGAGNGRTITADAGAVLIDGTDGLVSTGAFNTGAVAPSGTGVRMVWNPRKAAFRAGNVTNTNWDDANIGTSSVALGNNPLATGLASVAIGNVVTASGLGSSAFGTSSLAIGRASTVFGRQNIANTNESTAFGYNNVAFSYGETVLGLGATFYTPSTNGATQFGIANATDRLFVIGNAIDSNNNSFIDATERSNAMVVLKNGNTGIGSSAPQERLHVAGRSLFTNGFSTDNAALLYRDNTDYMFLGPQSGSSANGAAMALFGSTNAVGGNLGGIDFNVPIGQLRMNHTNGNYVFRANSSSGYTATFELNDIGLQMGHNSASRAILFNTASTEQMRLTATGQLGIGTPTPLDKLHVVGNIRMVDGNQAVGRVFTSDANGTGTWQNVSNIAWGLIGNAGTNPATNFIGTTDDNDVVLKRNNVIAGKIASRNTSLGLSAAGLITTGVNNNALGDFALSANTSGNDNNAFGTGSLQLNSGGFRNSAFGSFALDNSVGDIQNSAFGAFVLGNNNGGNSNSGFGYNALIANSNGSNNTAVGATSMILNTTGSNNTAVGFNSLSTINQGSNNTGIGVDTATTSTLLTNATAIGYKAIVGASNSVVIGSINGQNGATTSVNVGIGTVSPQTALEVVDTNTATSATVEGIVNIMTNGPQAIDAGGSITLGGTTTDAGTTFRHFGSIEGRKATATTGASSGYLHFKTNSGTALLERMRITSAGDVGIGTALPGGQFELSLNEGRKPGTSTWTIVSDQRLKTINGNYTKGLNEILQLNPILFNYKNSGERTFEKEVLDSEFAGFIAQEVQPHFPEAIGTDDDGFLNFNIHPIMIASINAFKELNNKYEELKNKNEELEAKLKSLLSRIESLENK